MAGCFERANKRHDIRCFFSLIRCFAEETGNTVEENHKQKRGFNQNGNKAVFHSIMHLSVLGHQKTCCFPPRHDFFYQSTQLLQLPQRVPLFFIYSICHTSNIFHIFLFSLSVRLPRSLWAFIAH